MKHRHFVTIILFLIVALSTVISASAEKVIDPTKDAVFTCGSNPDSFSGKTYDNLYVLLKGCTDLRSTIIQEDNVFLTLRNIKVNGTLYYLDDSFDRNTEIYTESVVGENETYADHYFNIAGNSVVNRMELTCINPHDCHFGLQYPSYVDELYMNPVNPLSRGKIVLHGYIDPLVDEKTDYYNDEKVYSYPTLDLKSYENEFGHAVIASEGNIRNLGFLDMLYYIGMSDTSETWGRTKQISTLQEFYDAILGTLSIENEYRNDVDNVYNLFLRGYINKIFITNNYEQNIGETYIDLANISCDQLYISNQHKDSDSYRDTQDLDWKPVIESIGYTNIGLMSVYANVKTTAVNTNPYIAGSESIDYEIPPLYIDVMVIGNEGKQTNVDINLTKIIMANYLGGIDKNSQLNLRTSDKNIIRRENQTSIGVLTINGGKLNYKSDSMIASSPTIKKLYILPGREDFRFATGINDEIVNATSVLRIPTIQENIKYSYTSDETKSKPVYELIDFFMKNGSFNQIKTPIGFNWMGTVLNNYMDKVPDEITVSNNTKINTQNASLGDIYVDALLGSDFFSGSCNFYQWGKPEATIKTIN